MSGTFEDIKFELRQNDVRGSGERGNPPGVARDLRAHFSIFSIEARDARAFEDESDEGVVSGPGPQEFGGILSQVDDGGGLGGGHRPLNHNVNKVAEAVLNLPAAGLGLLLAGADEGGGQDGAGELRHKRLGDGVVGDAHPKLIYEIGRF